MAPSIPSPALRATGQLTINKEALRAALGGGAIVERQEAAVKVTGRPSVNAAQMWRYFTTSVYASGDLPIIATREALQNSVDAIRAAVRARQIPPKAGKFDVTWDANARTLSWSDNGIGMDATAILTKFLSLGDSGKREAGSSDEAAGGFGIAKAVILGASASFRWDIYTRDNHAASVGAHQDVAIYASPMRQGTRITVYDVPQEFDSRYSYPLDAYVPIVQRLLVLLGANDLPDCQLTLNGETVQPLFSRRGGSRISDSGNWGEGTSALVRAYRRPPGKRGGAFYVRLGGLHQFEAGSSSKLPADIVIDLTTTVRPGGRGYPLNAARDQLQTPASWAMQDLVREVERENESVGRSADYDVYRAASDATLSSATESALAEPDVRQALSAAANGLADYYRSRASQPRSLEKPSSTAPAGSRVAAQTTDGETNHLLTQVAGAADSVKSAAETARLLLAPTGELDPAAAAALQKAAAGILAPHDVPMLAATLARAEQAALAQAAEPGGAGLIQASAAQRALEPLRRLLPDAVPRPSLMALAGLRVSKRNFDRGRAARFRAGFARWLPYLVVWDATLRMVAGAAGIRRRFSAGFVLDDGVEGLAARESADGEAPRYVIYVHPFTLRSVVTAHKSRPYAIAYWLHALACHELTHFDGRMGDGHNESFVAAREDLGFATAHLLEPIAELIRQVLSLPSERVPRRERDSTSSVRQLAEASVGSLADRLEATPPPGVDPAAVGSFFARHRETLVRALIGLVAKANP